MILGVSFDSPEANRKFVEKQGFPYQLLSDGDKSIALDYGAAKDASAGSAARIGYLINGEGKVAKVYAPADAETFAEDVLNDI